jgi:large subunit ribosomal protein L17
MLRNLAANLITHERIETTEAKAKELRRVAEQLITKARRLGTAAYTPHKELSAADQAKRLHVSRLIGSYLPRFGVKADGTKIDIVEKVMTIWRSVSRSAPEATRASSSSDRVVATTRR